jgi:hypothetical protein
MTGPRAERAPDQDWSCRESRSGVPAGTQTIFFDLSRWLRSAPPPANFRRPSGARNSFAEFASSIYTVWRATLRCLSVGLKNVTCGRD